MDRQFCRGGQLCRVGGFMWDVVGHDGCQASSDLGRDGSMIADSSVISCKGLLATSSGVYRSL